MRRLRATAAKAAVVLSATVSAGAQDSPVPYIGAIDTSAFPQVSLKLVHGSRRSEAGRAQGRRPAAPD